MANVIGLSQEHEDNLRKLAKYLLAGELKAKFDMGIYCGSSDRNADCGTMGCAIGHGPFSGIDKLNDEGWTDYADRVFGCEHVDVWTWCFCSDWEETDNTATGAAKSILWLLEHGIPDTYKKQMNGVQPLCYVKP